MNKYFRNTALASIRSGISHIEALDDLDHPVLRGKLREVFVNDFLSKFSPSTISFTSGKIVDRNGNESGEIDIIAYSREYVPSIIISVNTSIVPVESVYYAFEIKTSLNAKTIQDSIKKFERLYKLQNSSSLIRSCLIGFKSTLKNNDELARYKIYDKNYKTNPSCKIIIGPKQYCYFETSPLNVPNVWMINNLRKSFEEYLLDFLAGYSNTIQKAHADRENYPFVLGEYLVSYSDC